MVLAAERDGPDRALNGVGVKFDASIIEEAAKSVPAGQRITDRISKAAAGWDVGKLAYEPALHGPDQRQRSGLAHGLPYDGGPAPDSGLDRIELGNTPQRLGRDGRAGRLMDLVELTPRMRPAGREPDIAAFAETIEPGIAVDLDHAFELGQMGGRPLGLPVRAVEARPSIPLRILMKPKARCTFTFGGSRVVMTRSPHR